MFNLRFLKAALDVSYPTSKPQLMGTVAPGAGLMPGNLNGRTVTPVFIVSTCYLGTLVRNCPNLAPTKLMSCGMPWAWILLHLIPNSFSDDKFTLLINVHFSALKYSERLTKSIIINSALSLTEALLISVDIICWKWRTKTARSTVYLKDNKRDEHTYLFLDIFNFSLLIHRESLNFN